MNVIYITQTEFTQSVINRIFNPMARVSKRREVQEWADRFLHLYAFPGEPLHPAEVEEAIQDCLDAVITIRRMSRRELAGFSGGTA